MEAQIYEADARQGEKINAPLEQDFKAIRLQTVADFQSAPLIALEL